MSGANQPSAPSLRASGRDIRDQLQEGADEGAEDSDPPIVVCVIGNSRLAWKYYREVTRIVFKWLNRRSQRKSYIWKQFGELWGKQWGKQWGIPRPRTSENQVKLETGELGLV